MLQNNFITQLHSRERERGGGGVREIGKKKEKGDSVFRTRDAVKRKRRHESKTSSFIIGTETFEATSPISSFGTISQRRALINTPVQFLPDGRARYPLFTSRPRGRIPQQSMLLSVRVTLNISRATDIAGELLFPSASINNGDDTAKGPADPKETHRHKFRGVDTRCAPKCFPQK